MKKLSLILIYSILSFSLFSQGIKPVSIFFETNSNELRSTSHNYATPLILNKNIIREIINNNLDSLTIQLPTPEGVKILNLTKGYWGARGNVWTIAKNTLEKGLTYAYRDRKNKKRTMRSLWIQRINAGVRQYGMSYSEFIGKVNSKNIGLNRKVLADLAMNHPEAFKAVVDQVK